MNRGKESRGSGRNFDFCYYISVEMHSFTEIAGVIVKKFAQSCLGNRRWLI
jgi:hypothetical protein